MDTDITFYNVLITIRAENAKEAYKKLCDLLNDPDVEYCTSTFTDLVNDEENSTEVLFP